MYDETDDAVGRLVETIKRKHGRVDNSIVPASETIDIGNVRAKLVRPAQEQDEAPLDGYGLYSALISRIPHSVQASFAPEQTQALRQAAEQLRWGKHSVDFRMSLPIPKLRLYCVFLAGIERRSKKRIEEEGQAFTTSNLVWLIVWAIVVWIVVYGGVGGFSTWI